MDRWEAVASRYDPLKAGSIDGTDEFPHDNGIFRAMNAKYKPNKNVQGIPENTIFVGRLSPYTDEESIEKHFSEYGKIKRLRLIRDIVTGTSRCYAFVEFFDEKIAYRSQKHLDKTILDEKEIYVDLECERTLSGWRPRRLGGGIGGQKESGQLRFGGKNRPFRKPFNIDGVVKPEGETFIDRFRNMEERDRSERRRSDGRKYSDYYSRNSKESTSNRRGQRSRSRERRQRSRSRERKHRSRSQERRQRSRSHGRRSRSPDRSRYRSRS